SPLVCGASTGAPCVAAEAERERVNFAGAAAVSFGGSDAMRTRAVGGLAVAEAGVGAAGSASPSSCRTNSLIGPDKSVLHAGQMKRTGSRAISGVTSMAYLAPQ